MGSCDILSVLFGLGVWCIAYISVAVFASFRILHSVFSLWLFFFLEDFCFVTMGYAQLVIGPAGSGKVFSCQFCFVITMRFWLMRLLGVFFLDQSTYCSSLYEHCETVGRTMNVVNLDPAAEIFNYPVAMGELFNQSLGFLVPLTFLVSHFFFSFAVLQISESLFLWKM